MTGERLRQVGAELVAAALREIDPARRVAETLSDLPALAEWVQGVGRGAVGAPERPGPTDRGGRTVLVAFGKAAVGMTRGAVAVLGRQIEAGLVVTPHPVRGLSAGVSLPEGLPDGLQMIHAGHPLPDQGSLGAGRRIGDLLDDLTADDRVIMLISGGGSALVTLPAGTLTLDDLRATTELLLESGLPIEDVNDVRRVLDDLKGGGMARRAHPAAVLALVLSDIPSGDSEPGLRDVASGPLSPPGVSCRDVEIRLRRVGLFDRLPDPVQRHLRKRRESGTTGFGDAGSGDMGFRATGLGPAGSAVGMPRLYGVGGGDAALRGMRAAAVEAGFSVQVLHPSLRGEAAAVGRGLARAGIAAQDGIGDIPLPACLIAAGETTVQVVGDGVGGPNQETALAAARPLDGRSGILVASFGTDGIDGPTRAAGGWVDGNSWARARDLGLDPDSALSRNDSGTILKALDDQIRTGPTGTNVADVMFVLVT